MSTRRYALDIPAQYRTTAFEWIQGNYNGRQNAPDVLAALDASDELVAARFRVTMADGTVATNGPNSLNTLLVRCWAVADQLARAHIDADAVDASDQLDEQLIDALRIVHACDRTAS